jgi:hypothetical protein
VSGIRLYKHKNECSCTANLDIQSEEMELASDEDNDSNAAVFAGTRTVSQTQFAHSLNAKIMETFVSQRMQPLLPPPIARMLWSQSIIIYHI